MKKKTTMLSLVVILIISMCACGNNSKDTQKETYEQRQVKLTEDKKWELEDEIECFIEQSGTGSSLEMFNDEVILEDNDVITGLGVYDLVYYVSNSAIYLRVDKYMYRFQLDNSNKVVSYIKYTVEA